MRRVEKICKKHGLQEYFAYNDHASLKCRKCDFEYRRNLRLRKKKILVGNAGGKCCRCGYNKNLKALHFHHLDPSQKKHELGMANLVKSIDLLQKEADKCILLCANCHAEEHDSDNYGVLV